MNVARLNKLTRLPVYQDEPDHVVGLVHVMDLAFDEKPTDKYARDYMRPPQFVPAETPINELLPRMQLTRQPMALVTDEESAVLGLVTTQDVLQEIVGKL
jgi:CBS domain containing-hemolysin-like protein